MNMGPNYTSELEAKQPEALRLIRELYFAGRSLQSIADELNARGIPGVRRGNWYAATVSNAVKREAIEASVRLELQRTPVGAPGTLDATLHAARRPPRGRKPLVSSHPEVVALVKELHATGRFTLTALAHELTARGAKTARGGRWHPATVARTLKQEPEMQRAGGNTP